MHKTTHKIATISTRIEPKVKKEAEKIFERIGLSAPEAIRLFYKNVCLYKGIPFPIKIPNAKTLAAIKDVEQGKTINMGNIQDFFNTLDKDNEN